MNYKNIAFIALLLPLTIASYGKNIEIQIKELLEDQLSKEWALSEIGEIIAKKESFLENFSEKTQALLNALTARKKAKLESQNNSKLSDEETKKLANELRDAAYNFFHTAYAAAQGEGSIEGILTNGMFDDDIYEDNKELNALKFFLIQCAFERNLMIKLVQQYESYIQELGKINRELGKLKILNAAKSDNTLATTATTASSEVISPSAENKLAQQHESYTQELGKIKQELEKLKTLSAAQAGNTPTTTASSKEVTAPAEKKEKAIVTKQPSAFEEGMAGVLLGGLIVIWLARNF